MTKETLIAYIERHRIEWHRTDIGVIIMPLFSELQGFADIAGRDLDEDGISAIIQNGNVHIEIEPICLIFGIDPNEVFIGNHSNYTK